MSKLRAIALITGLVLALISGWVLLKVIKVAAIAIGLALAVLVVSAGVVYLVGRRTLE